MEQTGREHANESRSRHLAQKCRCKRCRLKRNSATTKKGEKGGGYKCNVQWLWLEVSSIRHTPPSFTYHDARRRIRGSVSVKAADPLAKPGMPLYYFHSKTKIYNNIFFHFWDNVMTPAFAIVCPWFTVDTHASLGKLFALEFEK